LSSRRSRHAIHARRRCAGLLLGKLGRTTSLSRSQGKCRRSGGRAQVEIYNAASPFGKPTEQASEVRAGSVDIALGLRGAEGEKFPGSSIIELPFVVPSAAQGSRVLWELYKDGTLADEYRDYKVLALFVHNPGLIHTT
jgi:TRAP-type C4-dicarboxylate transport system substrate-binding protein